MRFQPKTEAELNTGDLWPVGDYSFEVTKAEDQRSKAGSDMVKLTLKVFDDSGNSKTVWDYLVGAESSQFKVRAFAVATGMLDQYNDGQLEAVDMEGRSGRCKVIQQIDKTGAYPDKNSIGNYLKPNGHITPPTRKGSNISPKNKPIGAGVGTDLDDSIPFGPCWQ